MQLVIDANIFFSALLKDSYSRRLILDGRIQLFAPKFLLSEFEKHSADMLVRSKLDRDEFGRIYILLIQRIIFIEESELMPYLPAAYSLIVDKKDAPYVATALCVNAEVWSNDRHFRKGRVRNWATAELISVAFE
ncbi:MAG: PIN domain-containing protein [Candidatus Micrarchaeota archaeon]